MTEGKLLRAGQVAERLNISLSYAYLLMDRGVFKVMTIGSKCKRVPESEVERVRAERMEKENPAQG